MSAPLPETTRVRGGGSARIGAVVVAVVLVAIVWVGISGRPNPAPISALPTQAAPTSVESAPPSSRPQPAAPSPAETPALTPEPADSYGASLTMGKVRYVTILSELEPGHLTGELIFPSPPLLPSGRFTFSELWRDGQVEGAVAIDQWAIDLETVASATRTATTVVDASVPAQRALLDVPPPVTSGYEISVVGSNDLLFSQLSIDVRLGQVPGDEAAGTSTVRFGVEAMFGKNHESVILTPNKNGSFRGTLTLPRPRRAVDARFRLSDVQLTVSHGLWSEIDEFGIELTPEMANAGVSKLLLQEAGATYRLVARTNGDVRGQSITVTVIARRVTPAE